MKVRQFAEKLSLWQRIEEAVVRMSGLRSTAFLDEIAQIPIRNSWAARRLGSYVSKGDKPVCIRLQFAQEPDVLEHTFLHEIAHACDHLSCRQQRRPYRGSHRSSWKYWARALGVETKASGRSSAVQALYQQRLKPVAVCQKCGTEFHRVRRLSRNRRYIHNQCGGRLQPI